MGVCITQMQSYTHRDFSEISVTWFPVIRRGQMQKKWWGWTLLSLNLLQNLKTSMNDVRKQSNISMMTQWAKNKEERGQIRMLMVIIRGQKMTRPLPKEREKRRREKVNRKSRQRYLKKLYKLNNNNVTHNCNTCINHSFYIMCHLKYY